MARGGIWLFLPQETLPPRGDRRVKIKSTNFYALTRVFKCDVRCETQQDGRGEDWTGHGEDGTGPWCVRSAVVSLWLLVWMRVVAGGCAALRSSVSTQTDRLWLWMNLHKEGIKTEI